MSFSSSHNPRLTQATLLYAPVWLVTWLAWLWWRELPAALAGVVFAVALPLGAVWLTRVRRARPRSPVSLAGVGTVAALGAWQFAVFALDAWAWDSAARSLVQIGLGLAFLTGLAWVVWWVERRAQWHVEQRSALSQSSPSGPLPGLRSGSSPRPLAHAAALAGSMPTGSWNPLDPDAWYYGRKGRKLNQSLTVLVVYSLAFSLLVTLLSQTRGCQEIYELPAGGGQMKQLAQTVRIQKVIRKKFVVNPYSGIKFAVPPIDDIKLQLTEVTQHAYAVGYGEGAGAGFAGGTQKGRVRLIRLEYTGGDWDLNFGVGADLNMLVEYGVRTQHKVAEQTESRTVLDLKSFPVGKAPPLVFLTGQKNVSLNSAEIKALREYLHDKHGMLFVSNGGSGHFHNQVLALMNQVAPEIRPVSVPLDDPIHSVPYRIHAVPIVAPHGGREALGWFKDGRWICYYHPGDISDAWCDDHAGVTADVWEACYQLGTNVIFYAHAEHSKWLAGQRQP